MEINRRGRRTQTTEGETQQIRAIVDTMPVNDAASKMSRSDASGLIGRAKELNELTRHLEDALHGSGRLVLVSGEAGIGKTRIARELAAEAGVRGAEVVWAPCWEPGGAPPFWPWIQVIRRLIREGDSDQLLDQLGASGALLARIVPEIASLSTPDAPDHGGPNQARFELFDATASFLLNVGADHPLVIVFDDLHWADESSLLLLQFLSPFLSQGRILIVGNYREPEARRGSLGAALSNLLGKADHIRLPRLAAQHVASFIEAGGLPSDPRLAEALHRATDGNPFFVQEVVKLLRAEGDLAEGQSVNLAGFRIPDEVRQAVRERLGLLSDAANELLRTASVIGREFSLVVLECLSDMSMDDLLDLLQESLDEGIIEKSAAGVGVYTFSHALIRETIYDDLVPARRLRMHYRIGEALEALYGTEASWLQEQLAHHFYEAMPLADSDKAIAYSTAAGKVADEALAYEEAAEHYGRALYLLGHLATADIRACKLYLDLGEAQAKQGQPNRARESLQRAAELARRLDEPLLLARAALGFARGLAGIGAAPGVVDQSLVALLEEALRVVPPADATMRARLLSRLAIELYFSEESERRVELAREAVELSRREGDLVTLGYAYSALHFALWGPDTLDERFECVKELLRLSQEAQDRELALQAHTWALVYFFEIGDIGSVSAQLDAYQWLAESLRQRVSLWHARVWEGAIALMEGRLEDAETLISNAIELGQEAQSENATQYFGVQMFALLRDLDRLEELEPAVRDLAQRYPRQPAWRCALAFLYATSGRKDECRREFEQIVAQTDTFAALPKDMNWYVAVSSLAEACHFLRDAERAKVLYEMLLPYADRIVIVGPAAATRGSLAHHLALVAEVLGRTDDAERHFAAAIAANQRLGAVLQTSHSEVDRALMRLSGNDPVLRRQAIDTLRREREVTKEFGFRLYERKVETALAELDTSGEGESSVEVVTHPTRDARFRHEGEFWTISYNGCVSRLRDSRGLHYIAYLLRNPDQEVHSLDLVTAPGSRQTKPPVDGSFALDSGDAGEVLDSTAKAAYRERLKAIDDDIDEAESFNDHERAARLREEKDALVSQLAQAVGLRGRDRRAASAAERARQNATRAIRSGIKRIAEGDPVLGRHLSATIHTGIYHSYTPDPQSGIRWIF